MVDSRTEGPEEVDDSGKNDVVEVEIEEVDDWDKMVVGEGVRKIGTERSGEGRTYGKGWKEVAGTDTGPKEGEADTADSKEVGNFGSSGSFGNCSGRA